jgi:hypothetical protein
MVGASHVDIRVLVKLNSARRFCHRVADVLIGRYSLSFQLIASTPL